MSKHKCRFYHWAGLIVLAVSLFPSLSLRAENLTEMIGWAAFSPSGRSYRFKNPPILPDNGRTLLGGIAVYKYANRSMLFVVGEGYISFWRWNTQKRGKVEFRGSPNALCWGGFGYSIIGRRALVPYAGLGFQMPRYADVKEENGEEIYGAHDGKNYFVLAVGLRSKLSDRFTWDYSFITSQELRHSIIADLKVYHLKGKREEPNNFADIYLTCGYKFDERRAYNLFGGIKLNMELDRIFGERLGGVRDRHHGRVK